MSLSLPPTPDAAPALAAELDASDLGRLLAACRKRTWKQCEVCNGWYEGLAHGKYCSDKCNWAAYYERHREARQAAQRERTRQRRQHLSALAGQHDAPAGGV